MLPDKVTNLIAKTTVEILNLRPAKLLLEGTRRTEMPSISPSDCVTSSGLMPDGVALSCHLMVGDVPLKSTARILDDVNAMLARDYRIAHTTIQFELAECDADDPFCVPFHLERRRPGG